MYVVYIYTVCAACTRLQLANACIIYIDYALTVPFLYNGIGLNENSKPQNYYDTLTE